MSDNVKNMVSVTDTASDLKKRFAEALKPVLELAKEAAQHEIDVQLVFTRNGFGQLQLEAKLIKFL